MVWRCGMVKRIDVRAIVKDGVTQNRIHFEGLVEIERYGETVIPKDKSIIEEHSFDELFEGLVDIANAAWNFVKGIFKVSKWAIILIVEGIRFLWREGIGKKGQGKDEKKKG